MLKIESSIEWVALRLRCVALRCVCVCVALSWWWLAFVKIKSCQHLRIEINPSLVICFHFCFSFHLYFMRVAIHSLCCTKKENRFYFLFLLDFSWYSTDNDWGGGGGDGIHCRQIGFWVPRSRHCIHNDEMSYSSLVCMGGSIGVWRKVLWDFYKNSTN